MRKAVDSSGDYLSDRAARSIRKAKKPRKRRTNQTAIKPRVLLGDEPWSCQFCESCREWAAANPQAPCNPADV